MKKIFLIIVCSLLLASCYGTGGMYGGYGGYGYGASSNYLLNPYTAVQQANSQMNSIWGGYNAFSMPRSVPATTSVFTGGTSGGVVTSSSTSTRSSTSSSSRSTTTKSSTSSNSGSSRRICVSCNGSGTCKGCHGSGKRTDNLFGTGTNYAKKCGVCGGGGRCSVCHGSGYR